MQRALDDEDTSGAHANADRILLYIAKFHGYTKVAALYEKVSKWYA